MQKTGEQMADYLHHFRRGDRERAFHGLLETENASVPALIDAFRNEDDAETREFLVEVIWQHRQVSAIPFLAETLFDEDPAVWKQALDGLVALASPATLEVLRSARSRPFADRNRADDFLAWLNEGIEQVELRLGK